MEFHKSMRVSLRGRPDFSEAKLQQQITDDPSLLGLGDLVVREAERSQPQGGRIDLLLSDPETRVRYVVELQLGATDPSHIIRTIEYWDIERRRYPQYEHVAVIAAEEITSRFLNVVSLFNGHIPLIAIQVQGLEVNGAFTIVATRVLDLMTLGTDEEDEGETVDRAYWQQKASPESMRVFDGAVKVVQSFEPELTAKYNKHYIGLARNGVARNLAIFRPRKSYVLAEFGIPHSDELTTRLEDAGLDLIAYDVRWKQYRVRLTAEDLDSHEGELRELIERARTEYGG